MVLLAESLNTLSRAALILGVSLCLCLRERGGGGEKKEVRGGEKILVSVDSLRRQRRSLHDPSPWHEESAGWSKKLDFLSLRVLLAFWQLHNKATQCWSCALRKKTKLAKRTNHLSFDKKTNEPKKKVPTQPENKLCCHALSQKGQRTSPSLLQTQRALNFALNAAEKKGGNYAYAIHQFDPISQLRLITVLALAQGFS